ncbi:ORFA10 [Alcelaphine gammaherpesvirus 1]|nr:ORFA10 [Alcelaphine gammaherpesvirus 1]QDY92309.1 membrane protein A10 [Alcelaphine gammaherpesvirus 1]
MVYITRPPDRDPPNPPDGAAGGGPGAPEEVYANSGGTPDEKGEGGVKGGGGDDPQDPLLGDYSNSPEKAPGSTPASGGLGPYVLPPPLPDSDDDESPCPSWYWPLMLSQKTEYDKLDRSNEFEKDQDRRPQRPTTLALPVCLTTEVLVDGRTWHDQNLDGPDSMSTPGGGGASGRSPNGLGARPKDKGPKGKSPPKCGPAGKTPPKDLGARPKEKGPQGKSPPKDGPAAKNPPKDPGARPEKVPLAFPGPGPVDTNPSRHDVIGADPGDDNPYKKMWLPPGTKPPCPTPLWDPCAVLLSDGSTPPWDRRKGIHRHTTLTTPGPAVTPVYLTISDDDLDERKGAAGGGPKKPPLPSRDPAGSGQRGPTPRSKESASDSQRGPTPRSKTPASKCSEEPPPLPPRDYDPASPEALRLELLDVVRKVRYIGGAYNELEAIFRDNYERQRERERRMDFALIALIILFIIIIILLCVL